MSNQTIAAAAAQMRAAQAATQAARAALFPSLGGGASATRGARAGTTSGGGTYSVSNVDNVLLDAGWEIDLWGRVQRTVEASARTAQASAADLAAATLSVQAQLAQDYFLLRVQDAQSELLQDTAADYERSLELTRNQYAAGIVGRGDVVQAETQLKATQAQAIDARLPRAQLEHAIAVLVGKPPSELAIAPQPLRRGLSRAAGRRALGAARAPARHRRRRAARGRGQRADRRRAGRVLSALSLSAVGGFQSSAIGSLLTLPSRFWSLGPALAQPLFDAGLRSAQKEQAIAQYDATVAGYRQTVLTAFQEVEDNLAALALLEQRSRGAGRGGRGRARSRGDRHQPVQGGHGELPRESSCCRRRRSTTSGPRSRCWRAAWPPASH